MDIKEFTENFVIKELHKICRAYQWCSGCPFFSKHCKLTELDCNLVEKGEDSVWSL